MVTKDKRDSIVRNLRKYDAMSFDEIASVMNRTPSEVEQVCRREACEGEKRDEERGRGKSGRVYRSEEKERCHCCGEAPADGFGLRVRSGVRVCYPCHEAIGSGRIKIKPKADVERPLAPCHDDGSINSACLCDDPPRELHVATSTYWCRDCGGWIRQEVFSEEVVACRNEIQDGLQKVYVCRNRSLGPMSKCRWTELEEVLGEMHGHVEHLLGRVAEIRHQYGEPEREATR